MWSGISLAAITCSSISIKQHCNLSHRVIVTWRPSKARFQNDETSSLLAGHPHNLWVFKMIYSKIKIKCFVPQTPVETFRDGQTGAVKSHHHRFLHFFLAEPLVVVLQHTHTHFSSFPKWLCGSDCAAQTDEEENNIKGCQSKMVWGRLSGGKW